MTKHTRTQQDQAQWQQQRDERMSTLLQQLEAGVQAIHTSDDFKRYLRTAATFHQYSPNNVLLILAQKPEAIRVAGYKTWQSLGRQVQGTWTRARVVACLPRLRRFVDESGRQRRQQETALRRWLTGKERPVVPLLRAVA